MTIVIYHRSELPVVARGNAKSRRKAARQAATEQHEQDVKLARRIATAAAGCTAKALKATSYAGIKETQYMPSGDNRCLNDIYIYSNNDKKPKAISAR